MSRPAALAQPGKKLNSRCAQVSLLQARRSNRQRIGGLYRYRPNGLFLLETRTAENRSTLGRLKRNSRFRAAGGTRRPSLGTNPSATRSLCLALLAVLGVVLKLFVVEKQLLTRGEHKLNPAVRTLQHSVDKFHGRLPQSREERSNSAMNLRACRSRLLFFASPSNKQGPGPPQS